MEVAVKKYTRRGGFLYFRKHFILECSIRYDPFEIAVIRALGIEDRQLIYVPWDANPKRKPIEWLLRDTLRGRTLTARFRDAGFRGSCEMDLVRCLEIVSEAVHANRDGPDAELHFRI